MCPLGTGYNSYIFCQGVCLLLRLVASNGLGMDGCGEVWCCARASETLRVSEARTLDGCWGVDSGGVLCC